MILPHCYHQQQDLHHFFLRHFRRHVCVFSDRVANDFDLDIFLVNERFARQNKINEMPLGNFRQ